MSEQFDDAEFGQGRRAPFTMLGDWVAVSGVDPNARSIYWDVRAHVNETRGTGTAWPPRDFLALLAGDKQARTVDPYLRQLEAINAIGAERERNIAKMRSRNLYKIHDTPPRGWDGPSSHADVWEWLRQDREACREYYVDRKAWLKEIEEAWSRVKRDEKTKGAKPSAPVSKEGHRVWLKECHALWSSRRHGKPTSPGSAVQRTTGSTGPAGRPTEGGHAIQPQNSSSAVERTTQCGTAHLGSAVERTGTTSKGNKKKEDAALPRSGGDGRSPSTSGSSAREAEGGCAASGKDSPAPSKKQPKHSRQELDLVAAVRRYFPQELTVPDIPAVSDAVLKALATGEPDSRTVDQLGSRIETRWHTHGWAMKVLEGEEIKSPVGVAINLVRTYGRGDKWGCANPRCEAGADIDTGAECNVCPERLEARKAARRIAAPTEQPTPDDEAQEQPTQPACDASSEPDYYPTDVRADGEGEPPAWAVLDEEPVVPAQGGGLDEFAAARAAMRDGKSDRIRRTNQYAR